MRYGQTVALACCLAGLLTAAPPVVTLPQEIKGEPSTFVTVRSEVTGASAVKFVPIDPGLSVFPAEMLVTKTATVVVAAKPGKYRLLAFAGNADGASEAAFTTLVIGTPTAPPVDPPKDPPAPIGGKKHYQLVRAGGPIQKWVEDALNLPAWSEVKALGHTVADITLDDVRIPPAVRTKYANQPTPFLLVWDHSGSQIVLPDNAPALPFPTTNDAIRGLLK